MARAKNRHDDDEFEVVESDTTPNPVWFKPVMFGFMLVGFIWILIYYIFGTNYPIPGLNAWNLVIGFAVLFVGLLMATRWR